MKTFLTLAALATFSMATAQKTTPLKDFKSLTVGADLKVTIVKSNENKLVTNNVEEDELQIEVKNGTLILNGDANNIILYYKSALENIVAASDAQISGIDEIKTPSLSVTAASDAKVSLHINVKNLSTAANSDAVVTLTGIASDHQASFASDAVFNGQELVTQNTSIALSSDARGVITAKGTVKAVVSSDGSLKIYGHPKNVTETKGSDAHIEVVD
jgi:hypothetical protein